MAQTVTYLPHFISFAVGWGTMIYLAAFAKVDEQLYEDAMIDGANRWNQVAYMCVSVFAKAYYKGHDVLSSAGVGAS